MKLHNFSFVDNNQNSCGKSKNIFVMRAVDHERKIWYNWRDFYLLCSRILSVRWIDVKPRDTTETSVTRENAVFEKKSPQKMTCQITLKIENFYSLHLRSHLKIPTSFTCFSQYGVASGWNDMFRRPSAKNFITKYEPSLSNSHGIGQLRFYKTTWHL